MTRDEASELLQKNLYVIINIDNKQLKTAQDIATKVKAMAYCEVIESFICLPPDEYNRTKDRRKAAYDKLKADVDQIQKSFEARRNYSYSGADYLYNQFLYLLTNQNNKLKYYSKSDRIEVIFV